MNDPRALVRQLEACVQEELGAQKRVLDLLNRQEAALREGAPRAIDAATRAMQGELASLAARTERRNLLVRRLATVWSVDKGALTLASIAARSGKDGERLMRMRADLRLASARVARQTRRNAQTANLHQRTWNGILEDVLDALTGDDAPSDGRLVDAEA